MADPDPWRARSGWPFKLVEIAQTPHGRGVVARVPIAAGQEIERCLVLPIPCEYSSPTILREYVFAFPDLPEGMMAAVVLGLGMVFNHSFTPNVSVHFVAGAQMAIYTATQDIPADAECRVDYGYDVALALTDPARAWYVSAWYAHHGAVTEEDRATLRTRLLPHTVSGPVNGTPDGTPSAGRAGILRRMRDHLLWFFGEDTPR